MGKTHAAKERERSKRLGALPRAERLAKQAAIKKQEGRVLNAAEKHAIKMTGDYGEIMKAWETLRLAGEHKGETTKEDAVAESWKLIAPQFEAASRTPRLSRVIQSCIKYGTGAQLEAILTACAKDFVGVAVGAYSHFIVCALLRHASHDLFRKLFHLLLTHMPALVSQKFGAYCIHTAYTSKMCTAVDRNVMILGIYKDSVAVMKQWKGYPILEQILEQEVTHRKRLISALFTLLDKLISQKEAFGYPFVQRLVGAFFNYGGKFEIQELAVTLKPHVGVFCDTREGSLLATQVISVLPPAQRKEALQAFKGYADGGILGLTIGKFTAPVVCRLCDLVYDPQILWKYVTGVLVEDIETVLASPYGHMLLLHLLTPEEDRKLKALLPLYNQGYNLYSRSNTKWNHVTWMDGDGNPETVEVCPVSASKTHGYAIRQLLPAVATFLLHGSTKKEEQSVSNTKVGGSEKPNPKSKKFADDDEDDGAAASGAGAGEEAHKGGKAKSGIDLHLARISKELLHLVEHDPEYKEYIEKALGTVEGGAEACLAKFRELAPKKLLREEETAAPVVAPVVAAKASKGPAKAVPQGKPAPVTDVPKAKKARLEEPATAPTPSAPIAAKKAVGATQPKQNLAAPKATLKSKVSDDSVAKKAPKSEDGPKKKLLKKTKSA